MQHAAQLPGLCMRLSRNAAENYRLVFAATDLRKENLERASLVLACGPDVATINRQRDGCRWLCWLACRGRDGLPLQSGANTKRSPPGRFHRLRSPERQKLRQHRPGAAIRQQRSHFRQDPLVFRRASIRHDFSDRTERAPASHRALAGLEARRFDGNGAKKRHQPAGTDVFQRPPGLAPLAHSPAPAMLLGLSLNQMTLRLRQYLLSPRERQSNRRRCVFCHTRAAAKLTNANRPICANQLQQNPPPHPTLGGAVVMEPKVRFSETP